jgi:hypothetical protein
MELLLQYPLAVVARIRIVFDLMPYCRRRWARGTFIQRLTLQIVPGAFRQRMKLLQDGLRR